LGLKSEFFQGEIRPFEEDARELKQPRSERNYSRVSSSGGRRKLPIGLARGVSRKDGSHMSQTSSKGSCIRKRRDQRPERRRKEKGDNGSREGQLESRNKRAISREGGECQRLEKRVENLRKLWRGATKVAGRGARGTFRGRRKPRRGKKDRKQEDGKN